MGIFRCAEGERNPVPIESLSSVKPILLSHQTHTSRLCISLHTPKHTALQSEGKERLGHKNTWREHPLSLAQN